MRMLTRVTTMGEKTPTPKDQGFLRNVNRRRVVGSLRVPSLKSVVDGKQVNIPVLLVTPDGGTKLSQLGVGCPSLGGRLEIFR